MDKDDLYDEAARIIVQSGQASISYLQRRLRIGFSRAARLVDMMEMEGLVSPAAAGKPREVLVDKHYFDAVDQQLRYALNHRDFHQKTDTKDKGTIRPLTGILTFVSLIVLWCSL